ncbi:ferritin-like domain-containing protein [Streptacidiphilus neutrinimicus]|uniref:ferritin-like domain-containing protein n=1 Tax=Streptacidiphilus neutrinimicus TaxID=105420 RepID=UPI000B2DAB4E|nr:ferritin-like protein [Streptacidiphilus neutrinimicus]
MSVTDSGSRRDDEERSGFGRRVLLTAAAGAAASVTVAGAAHADTLPAGRPSGPDGGGGAVARLLGVAERDRDLGWIQDALQIAVELELSTLPPYLCGWWSVKDRGSEAAQLIKRIVYDEMYHLGVVCNLMVAVGGQPRIKDAAPNFPTALPGGVRPGVTVRLSGLTRPLVRDVMMAIEAPEEPLAREGGLTIGAFYGAVLDAFRSVTPTLSTNGQLAQRIGADDLEPVTDLDAVARSIEIVREQGEGTSASPDDAFGDDHPAHYYAFGEIYHGRRLVRNGDMWEFTGEAVPFPDARPMAEVPAGGWPDPSPQVGQLLDRFDSTYATVLGALESAWADGGPSSLNTAVRAMRALESTAVELMDLPLPDGSGTYGPQFRPPS